jgi:hypothetical protein
MLTCVCENTFEADIPETVDLSADTTTIERILDGTFLTYTCPHCGHTIKPETPLRVIDPPRDIDFFLVPERERNSYLLGATEYRSDGRIVIGYKELVEKLKINIAGLDDAAVELIKFYLLTKAGPGASPVIFFQRCEGNELLFDIEGLKEDEIGKARIPRELYEKAVNELPEKRLEEPFDVFLEPPYVSITKIEIEEN